MIMSAREEWRVNDTKRKLNNGSPLGTWVELWRDGQLVGKRLVNAGRPSDIEWAKRDILEDPKAIDL